MWLFIVTFVTFVLLIISFLLFGQDIMHPSVVFDLFFLISEFTCICFAIEYDIVLHYQTAITMILGKLTFFAVSVLSYSHKIKPKINIIDEIIPVKIEVKKQYTVGLIICQFVSILFFIVYIRSIALKYTGSVGSLGSMIKLYDQANKFFAKELTTVPIPIAYRLFDPIGIAGGHIMLYVLVNN